MNRAEEGVVMEREGVDRKGVEVNKQEVTEDRAQRQIWKGRR